MRASLFGILALTAGCSFITNLDGYTSDAVRELPDATSSDSGPDGATDEAEAAADAACVCPTPISAYRFSDTNQLGHDFVGPNHMTTVRGNPRQSTVTPEGFTGYSIELDGSSTVCIDGGFTFNSAADHTLCWWSRPTALGNGTNQFAQFCSYDTWTANSGVDYVWHLNNCTPNKTPDLQVPSTYEIGTWAHICQTYDRAAMRRTVVRDGMTSAKSEIVDVAPIATSSVDPWCIGSYGEGGFWNGRIYEPMWFDRVLSDQEIERLHTPACCAR